MAEMFTAVAAMFGGGGAAATGAAVGTGAAAASTGFSLSTLFSVGSTIVGGLASISAGKQQAAALESQAQQENLKAVQDDVAGRQDATRAMRAMNKDLGDILVAGYGSGLEASGSIEAAMNEAQEVGEANMNTIRDNSKVQAAARRGQAAQYRLDAKGARSAGMFGALQGALSLGERRVARG